MRISLYKVIVKTVVLQSFAWVNHSALEASQASNMFSSQLSMVLQGFII
jgi:hypothetical protein